MAMQVMSTGAFTRFTARCMATSVLVMAVNG